VNDAFVGGRRVRLDPARAIGKGGEADVYDIGGGVALKVYKAPDHPDLAGLPDEQRAARERLASRPAKLREFPRTLPPRVVAPLELASDRHARTVGYTMRLVPGAEPLLRWGEPSFRRAVPHAAVAPLFLDLHATVAHLHEAGVVIGDFNDLNVLVAAGAAHLIDADSFQFGAHLCDVFTERFVDPLRCAPDALRLARPHTADSDWYAFATMLFQSLLLVHPYGGVAPGMTPSARALKRMTVFHADVRYPKPAISWRVLPDELLQYFHRTFERDARGMFPRSLLEPMRWTTCAACGSDHARTLCPSCVQATPAAIRDVVTVRGSVTATRLRAIDRPPRPRVWERDGVLWRDGELGPERIGDVLAGQARFWAGDEFGLGFYRAGTLSVGFVFERRLNDSVRLPIAGRLLDADCVFGAGRAWLLLALDVGGRIVRRCALVRRDGTVAGVADDPSWLPTVGGQCAAGPFLFAATDGGIVRVDESFATREYPDTEPFVDAESRLTAGRDGLIVENREETLRLSIQETRP
jgi:hypothetical protein